MYNLEYVKPVEGEFVVCPDESNNDILIRNIDMVVAPLTEDEKKCFSAFPELLTMSDLASGKQKLGCFNSDKSSTWSRLFFDPASGLQDTIKTCVGTLCNMRGYTQVFTVGIPVVSEVQFKPEANAPKHRLEAGKMLSCIPVALINNLLPFPLEFAVRLLMSTSDIRLTWNALRMLYQGSNILIPSLICEKPNASYRGAPIQMLSSSEQEQRFSKEGPFWRMISDDDFLPNVSSQDVESGDQNAAFDLFNKGIFYRDYNLLATAVNNSSLDYGAIDWCARAQDYSFGRISLSTKSGCGFTDNNGIKSHKHSMNFEMGFSELMKHDRTAVVVTPVVMQKIKENGDTASIREPSHHRMYTPSKAGLFAFLSLLMLLSTMVGAYPVKYHGVLLKSIQTYQDHFGVEEPPNGGYLVCFSGGLCVRRYRVGNNTMCDGPECTYLSLWPWLCPSPDRDFRCPDENCTGCDRCQGVVQSGECRYYSFTKQVRAMVKLIPPTEQEGIILATDDAYFKNFAQYREAVVAGQHNDTEIHTNTTLDENKDFSKTGMSLLGVALCITVLSIVVNTIRLAKFVKDKKDDEKLLKQDETEDGEVELQEADMGHKLEERIRQSKLARTWCTVSPHVSVTSLITEFILLCITIGSMVIVGVNADIDMHTLSEVPDRVTYLDYNLPSGCSCSNPDTVHSQLTCNLPCEYTVQIGDRTMEMHFALAQTCVDKYLVVLDNLRERQCHYCDSGSASAWCRSLRNACEPSVCHVTDTRHQAWTNGCFKQGGSVHRADLNYSIYPARYCTVSSSPAPGILGYPAEYYTVGYDSTLLANVEYVQAKIKGIWQDYKAINGGVGSQRAWLVPKSEVVDGKLVQGSNALESMLRFMVLRDNAEAGGHDMDVGLPEFSPVVFDQKCMVHITFSEMRCFTMEEACEGTYTMLRNATYFKPYKSGMCGGVYMKADEYTTAPSVLHKCGNCTMAKECIGSPLPDAQCSMHIDIDHTGNFTRNETGGVAWVEVEQSLTGILYLAIALALVAVVTVIIIAIVRKISHSGYQRVSH